MSLQERSEIEQCIRDRLAAGNMLAAADLAASTVNTAADSPRIRYLYLLSLASSGATQRALNLFPQLAPPAGDLDEDWLALPGRLHKDLALAGIDREQNLALAARQYRAAHAKTAGTFTGINAATLSVLAGEEDAGKRLAEMALKNLESESPGSEVDQYFWHATRAEALLILGRSTEAQTELKAANPLIRNNLATRSRTLSQLALIVAHEGIDASVLASLELPQVYVVNLSAASMESASIDPGMAQRLEGSPVFTAAPTSEAALAQLRALINVGARLHVVEPNNTQSSAKLRSLLELVESRTLTLGFLDDESEWAQENALRTAQGLARASAHSLGTSLMSLSLDEQSGSWRATPELSPAEIRKPDGRGMVGLVFADLVRFSRLSDEDLRTYWEQVMPRFAAITRPWGKRVLLRRTWGDGIHIATTDAESAAAIGLGLIKATQTIRSQMTGRLAHMEIRVGAHFAPAFVGRNAMERAGTVFGSQLSFAARVEPITPPGTMYVSEPFVAALQMECPDRFVSEYAGDVPLAKQYGNFRMASLALSPAAQEQNALDLAPPPLVVGVTGHLNLNSIARQNVRRALLPLLQVRFHGHRSITVMSGFAPGADLVVAEAISQAAHGVDADLFVRALLIAEPEGIVQHWLDRAEELGDSPSAAARAAVNASLAHWIDIADACERLDLEQAGHDRVFRALGAQLALTPDILIAVLRHRHPGQPGGAAEVVSWRRHPQLIPPDLSEGLTTNPSRELIIVDPDTGEVRIENQAS